MTTKQKKTQKWYKNMGKKPKTRVKRWELRVVVGEKRRKGIPDICHTCYALAAAAVATLREIGNKLKTLFMKKHFFKLLYSSNRF